MRILLIEDDRRLGRLIVRALVLDGQSATLNADGADGLSAARAGDWDVIVLDRRLPTLDGMEVLRALRASGDRTPVLLLTAQVELEARVAGLEAGADDYLGKPFAFTELLARVHALGRRFEGEGRTALCNGRLELDEVRHVARFEDEEVELSVREFALLAFLLRHVGEDLGRGVILEGVWGADAEAYHNVVDLYIGYLRRKLAGLPDAAIVTVRGVGYRLESAR